MYLKFIFFFFKNPKSILQNCKDHLQEFQRRFDDFPNIKKIQCDYFPKIQWPIFKKFKDQMRFNHDPFSKDSKTRTNPSRFPNIPKISKNYLFQRSIKSIFRDRVWSKLLKNERKNLEKSLLKRGQGVRRRKFVARQRVQWVSRLGYVISAGNLCGRGGGGRLLTELGRSIPRRYMGQVHYHVSLHMRAVPLERCT